MGRDAVPWQGATPLRPPAREEELRVQRAAARLNRVRSALTQMLKVVVGRDLVRTRTQLNRTWWVQTTHGRLSAPGQHADVVAAGRRRRPRSPAHARGRPSQTAIRSRIIAVVPCKHGGQPRIGPALGGTTTALCIRRGVPRLRMRHGCPGRWLGARAQAPFAVAATTARTDSVDDATPVHRIRCPASVGRRTCPGPPAPAPRLHAARREPRQLADRLSALQ